VKKIFLIAFVALFLPDYLHEISISHADEDKLIHALMKVENPNNVPFLVGDKHLKNKAVGPLQVRLPCVSDVNWIIGRKEMRRIWHKNYLTMKDMNDFEKARWASLVYVHYWGWIYQKQTGKKPTLEVYARIFNGGPSGWKKESTRWYAMATKQYGM